MSQAIPRVTRAYVKHLSTTSIPSIRHLPNEGCFPGREYVLDQNLGKWVFCSMSMQTQKDVNVCVDQPTSN